MMGCCRTGGAFGFPDRRWSRDPLVWLCLFEEETAIPVQVPAPSWESKRPSSSRGVLFGGRARLDQLGRPVVEGRLSISRKSDGVGWSKAKGGRWRVESRGLSRQF